MSDLRIQRTLLSKRGWVGLSATLVIPSSLPILTSTTAHALLQHFKDMGAMVPQGTKTTKCRLAVPSI